MVYIPRPVKSISVLNSAEDLSFRFRTVISDNRYEDMKVLNSGRHYSEVIHLSMFFFFDTPLFEKQNQNHGHGLLIPSLVQDIGVRVF